MLRSPRIRTARFLTAAAAIATLATACQPTPPLVSNPGARPLPATETTATPTTATPTTATPTTATPTTATPTTATPTTATPTTATPTTATPTTATPTTAVPTTTTSTPAPSNPTSATPTRAGWTYAGGDEFNGSSLNTSNWKAYHNTYGDGNNELACLTPNNVTVGGGSLKIRAKAETITCPGKPTDKYSSGFIGSREAGKYFPRYARYEIRAKIPHAQGLWPAFWLRHRNGSATAEVDIMEYFHSQVPGRTTATLHLDEEYNISKRSTHFENPTTTPGWHTWAVEIAPEGSAVRFTFFVDDNPVHTYLDTAHKWTSVDPKATFDIAVNLAVGGRWTGNPDGTLGYLEDLGRCAQGGTPPNACTTTGIQRVQWNNAAATTYEVDYVRVFTR